MEEIMQLISSIGLEELKCIGSALLGFALSFLRKKQKKVSQSVSREDLQNLIAYHQKCVDKLTERLKEVK